MESDMTYACSYAVPAPVEMYRKVRRLMGDLAPDGMIAHLVIREKGFLRHIEVWNSEEEWTQFHDEHVEPAVHHVLRAAGFTEMPPDPSSVELELVDVWLGASAADAA